MFQTLVWNGGLCVMPGTHKKTPASKLAGVLVGADRNCSVSAVGPTTVQKRE
jgi:hypothetical protein